ncbi:MAG: hypothetical protein J2P50_06245 [Hyphomicrobiaceae bacterium]|nr:hypothetical protein [Hyphomicrobiaceae bacterium]
MRPRSGHSACSRHSLRYPQREADANHDGALSREEFAAMARRDRLFEPAGLAYFDTDRDGRLTGGANWPRSRTLPSVSSTRTATA